MILALMGQNSSRGVFLDMMHSINYFTLISIALAVEVYVGGASPVYGGLTPRPPDREFATDMVTDKGLHIQMPFYMEEEMENELKAMVSELSLLIDKEMEENLNKLREIANRVFNDPTELRIYKWPGLGVEVVSMRMRQLQQRPQEYKDVPLSSLMGNLDLAMFSEIMNESELKAKQLALDVNNAKVLQEKVDKLTSSLIQAFKTNPTSTNVDYERMKIDGQPFSDYLADLMAEMRNCNFGSLLTLTDKTLHLLPGL